MKRFAFQERNFIPWVVFTLLPVLTFAANTNTPQRRSPDQVLLIVNENSSVSKAVADDYALKRHVSHILPIRCQDSALSARNETITLSAYSQSIEFPIRGFLATHTN